MADPGDPSQGGQQDCFTYFISSGVPNVIDALIRMQAAAYQLGAREIEDGAGRIMDRLLVDVNHAAQKFATLADGAIIRKIFETQSHNRPHQGIMETHIQSEPGPFGSVKVAMLAELEKILNPGGGYGSFWRAQEYGTGQGGDVDVPSQVGRPLFGTFEPSGEPPDASQRGLGAGHDLAFIPMGDAPGFGRINVDLPGRHFLRDGAAEAGAKYIAYMVGLRDKYIEQVQSLITTYAKGAQGGPGNVTFIVRA